MYCFLTKCRFAVLAVTVLFAWGCADMAGQLDQFGKKLSTIGRAEPSEPIATSLEQMPDDAATVTAAIRNRIMVPPRGPHPNATFAGGAGEKIKPLWSAEDRFVPAGVRLFVHQVNADDPSVRTAVGRLDFKGPFGRRASVRYEARYRTAGGGVTIDDAEVQPIFSALPEPMLFVVPAEAIQTAIPDTYGELLAYVGERSVPFSHRQSAPPEKKEYVIVVVLLDQISPSAKLEVKISDEPESVYGYKDSTRYIDMNGWRVALLAGCFILFDNGEEPDLFVKAVFTPGKEGGFIRTPKLMGLYCLNEPKGQS
ncbi:MAG: hypothetical protein KAT58_06875 [candidate division Zixibacteria bacterium]|nr:hypothetical protein [candidate division Zixibacteria bacterium]